MSLPVDYWDYLGWKDTLALHGHSNRERAYADARGDREVYTPQVVVNGIVHVLGSDKAAIEQAIAQTRAERGAADVAGDADGRRRQGDGECAGRRRRARAAREVWLCPITGKAQVAIERGENRGHTLTYYQRGAPLGEARRLDRQGGNLQRAGGQIFPTPIFRCRTSTASRWSCRAASPPSRA